MPEPVHSQDEKLRRILTSVRVIAMVGASPNPGRPSHEVMQYLQMKGFRVIPVNPRAAGEDLLGERIYPELKGIPSPIDMVDIFRDPRFVEPIVQDAIAIGARVVWMQLGVCNEAAAAAAEAAGLEVVMNRCPRIEFERLAIRL